MASKFRTMIILVAAAAEDNALGKDNQLLWHLPDDFKRFKELTTGHHIIMGRKTFESFPKPLPNRTHVVITRQKDYNPEGCIVVNSFEDAMATVPAGENAYVIGGGEIYNLSLPFADCVELTRVHAYFEDADAHFPELDMREWELVNTEYHPSDARHAFDFTYQTLSKKV